MYVDYVVWVHAAADYQGGSRTTLWDERGIMVPRCKICRDRHDTLKKVTKVVWGLAGVVLLATVFIVDLRQFTIWGFLTLALALTAIAIIVRALLLTLNRLRGTLPQSAAKKISEVTKFLDRGARLGRAPKPPPG